MYEYKFAYNNPRPASLLCLKLKKIILFAYLQTKISKSLDWRIQTHYLLPQCDTTTTELEGFFPKMMPQNSNIVREDGHIPFSARTTIFFFLQ